MFRRWFDEKTVSVIITMMIVAMLNTSVLTMEMTPDILPLLNAVNSPDAYVGIPLNTKEENR